MQDGLEQDDFQNVLKADGQTKAMQEKIQDWLEMNERDPGFQLLIERKLLQ
jgi:hypothetical protein